jgi:hypothetical protein
MPRSSAVLARASRARPSQSKESAGALVRVRGRRYWPATTATMPTGTLIRNTQRHPTVLTMTPPRAGPSARPRAWAPACTPSAARIRERGALVVTRATLLACSNAAPKAWISRKTMSVVRLGARPQAAEAAVKTMKP